MRVVVTSEDQAVARQLHESLLRQKNCSEVRVLPLEGIADRMALWRPDAVILCLNREPERALALVRDLRETSPARVLVVGPTAEAKAILQMLKEGVFQYIDQDDVDEELKTALQRLREEPEAASQFGSVIAVVGAGGGNGASTLVVNMAVSLRQCAAIDLRLESGDLATLLDLQPPHSLADFCRSVDRMDSQLFDKCLHRHSSGASLLAAPASTRDVAAVNARGIRKALGMARARFPYVVVDLDSPFRRDQAQVLYHADTILVVIRLDFTSVRHAQRLLDHFDELQIEKWRIRLVVSRYRRPRELRLADVEKTFGMEIVHCVPDDPRRVNRSNNQGIPVVLEFPRAPVSRSLQEISKSVNGRVSH